jgi:3-oxoadipate enol-lactonase
VKIQIGEAIFGCDVAGPERGAPIVFLHPFPCNRSLWKTQIQLLEKDFRLYAYDQRGLGESEGGKSPFSFEFFVDDLFAFLDHWKIEKVILCGLSMGGYVALRAIERSPERVQGLVLCDTRSEADSNEAKLKRAAGVRLVMKEGVAGYAETFLKSALTAATLSNESAIVQTVRQMITQNSPEGIAAALVALASRTDTTANLPNIKVPTLIMVGDSDTVTPPAAAESMKTAIPGARLEVIPKAAHLSNLENPSVFNSALLRFLQSLS